MITQITWYQDSDTSFDVTITGVGGTAGSAGCSLLINSPSGIWKLKAYDLANLAPSGKINIAHGSSTVARVAGTDLFIFPSYGDSLANALPAHDGESQDPTQTVHGWFTHQAMIIVSALKPQDPSTWTWVVNYNGYRL